MLDLTGDSLTAADPKKIRGVVSADKAEIKNIVTQPNPDIGGWRLSFELPAKNNTPVELRASLMQDDQALSETWIYRWGAVTSSRHPTRKGDAGIDGFLPPDTPLAMMTSRLWGPRPPKAPAGVVRAQDIVAPRHGPDRHGRAHHCRRLRDV